jgi:group I intron endonuclease
MIIYKITFPNNKIYIGITDNLRRRKKEHLRGIRKADRKHFPVYHAIAKYGKDSLVWEVVETCEDAAEAQNREVYWIEYYNSADIEHGYNCTKGGDYPSKKLYKFTDEEVEKALDRLRAGESLTKVAKEFRISVSHLWALAKNGYRVGNREAIETPKHLKGSDNPASKLTENKVKEIKRKLRENISRKILKEEYKVSKTLIQMIATGKAWTHVK